MVLFAWIGGRSGDAFVELADAIAVRMAANHFLAGSRTARAFAAFCSEVFGAHGGPRSNMRRRMAQPLGKKMTPEERRESSARACAPRLRRLLKHQPAKTKGVMETSVTDYL